MSSPPRVIHMEGPKATSAAVIVGWGIYAAGLFGLFVLCLFLGIAQRAWARAGRIPQVLIPGIIAADKHTAEFPETPVVVAQAGRQLHLRLTAKFASANRMPYLYSQLWVCDSAGREVWHSVDAHTPYHRPVDSSFEDIWLEQPGTYRVRMTLTADKEVSLKNASLIPSIGTRHVYLPQILAIGAVGVLVLMGRYVWLHPLPKAAAGKAPGAEAPPRPAPESIASGPVPAPLASKKTWLNWLALEALGFAISLAWLPVLGLYGIQCLMACAMLQDAAGTKLIEVYAAKFMALPFAPAVVDWIGMETEYHGGTAALSALGAVVARVVFLVYLVTLPIRLAVPRRFQPGFRGKAVLLLLLTLGMIGFYAHMLRFAKIAPGSSYGGLLAIMAFFCCLSLVLSLGVMGLARLVERAVARWINSAIPSQDTSSNVLSSRGP